MKNSEILLALKADLESHASQGIPAPDIVLVTGDLVQAGETDEYDEAAELFGELLEHLKLKRERLVLVPGNHDIHWPTSEDSFRDRAKRPADLEEDYIVSRPNSLLCALGPDEYQRRLDNFREFYTKFFRRKYPQERHKQYTIHRFDALGLAIAGFSSCDLNDHARRRGRIHPSAIHEARTQLSAFKGVRIAVWHHDLNWDLENAADCLDPESARYVSLANFNLGLCGHTHRPFSANTFQAMGLPLPLVAAGSLCAGKRERSDSVPRSYNIIELRPDRTARVNVRWKEGKSTPWRAIGKFSEAKSNNLVSWFDVPLADHAGQVATTDAPPRRQPGAVRTPHPFRQANAKSSNRSDIVEQFVWTDIADLVNNDLSQVILGPRGSGKTALLTALTFEGRVASLQKHPGDDVLARIGLMCPMRIGDVTAFAGKEDWQTEQELARAFSAMLANVLAYDLVSTLQKCETWCRSKAVAVPTEAEACALLWATWSDGSRTGHTFAELLSWITQQRTMLLQAVGIRDDHDRRATMDGIVRQPLMRGGVGPIMDAVTQLARWDAYSRTRWQLLFDEVEFVEGWQKRVVYEFLATATTPLSAKIATLPYAHRFALEEADASLLEGSDFDEVALAMTSDLAFKSDDEEETSARFVDVCRGIWAARLDQAGARSLTLEDVWPEAALIDVMRAVGGSAPATQADLITAMLNDLPPQTRARAEHLRSANDAAFSDQYWRKYQQPFRFRLANRLGSAGLVVPLYWGWRTLLRACDGNCRWFLQLADKCWLKHWARDGVRPLTPMEQHAVLCEWAHAVHRRLRTSTDAGVALQEVVERVASDFVSRLYQTKEMRTEGLAALVSNLTDEQAEAVGFGVAHGYLVPRLDEGQDAGTFTYPIRDVELRLGFPLAVDHRLPLRTGSAMKIRTLRQVVMPWLKDRR